MRLKKVEYQRVAVISDCHRRLGLRFCLRVAVATFAAKYNQSPSRHAAAWLARRLTVATLRELTVAFGLGHPDSVRNLTRRAERAMAQSTRFRKEVERLKQKLQRQ